MSETRMAAPGGGAAAQWRLDGRVALVTGASAGPGARFARVLHQAGAHVLATARRAGLLDRLAGECGERIEVMPGDITDASRGRRWPGGWPGTAALTCWSATPGSATTAPSSSNPRTNSAG